MRILILWIFLSFLIPFASPAQAADAQADKEPALAEPAKKEEAKKTEAEKKEEPKEIPGEYACPYYTARLPQDWKAVRAPEEKQGLVNAIFAKNSSSPVVTIIVGPRQGAEPDLIAKMFAEQFKADKAPSQKNDQFFFSYPQTLPDSSAPIIAHACLGIDGDYFMLTTYTGNQKEAQNFIKSGISSEEYPNLIPKF